VFDNLPAGLPRVVSVGRLDLDSEGLLLLTNDGALKRRLELPATGWTRRYRVRVHGAVDPAALAGLAQGITIEDIRYGPVRAALERQQGGNAWIAMSLTEGKNREVRRICEHLGWPVSRLIRVAYGPFQIGSLAPGAVEEVPAKVLQEQLGMKP
jgi:23S rRNA pseudouridine2605 synthase